MKNSDFQRTPRPLFSSRFPDTRSISGCHSLLPPSRPGGSLFRDVLPPPFSSMCAPPPKSIEVTTMGNKAITLCQVIVKSLLTWLTCQQQSEINSGMVPSPLIQLQSPDQHEARFIVIYHSLDKGEILFIKRCLNLILIDP